MNLIQMAYPMIWPHVSYHRNCFTDVDYKFRFSFSTGLFIFLYSWVVFVLQFVIWKHANVWKLVWDAWTDGHLLCEPSECLRDWIVYWLVGRLDVGGGGTTFFANLGFAMMSQISVTGLCGGWWGDMVAYR